MKRIYLQLPLSDERALISAARDSQPVSGLTHTFYKYPARFSPQFVRTAIALLSQPGDVVLDPFVGGGTSLVEALALGRQAIGVDISSLAEFVSGVKTAVLTERDLGHVRRWARHMAIAVDMHGDVDGEVTSGVASECKHLRHPLRWRLRKGIAQALAVGTQIRPRRLEPFVRCVVLRTAQWALDGRKNLPSVEAFRAQLIINAEQMTAGARELREAIMRQSGAPRALCLQRSAAGIEADPRVSSLERPKLVVTSPPYPGVHVLYHRWQVDGRKETPAPFWIANKLDGAGSSFYTMGDRKYPGLKTYFDNLRAAMSSVATFCADDALVVQVVAFSDASWQLPEYLRVLERIGLDELFLPSLRGQGDGRLWRSVPNRKWYSDQKGATPGSQEVVLLHRKQAAPEADSFVPPRDVGAARTRSRTGASVG